MGRMKKKDLPILENLEVVDAGAEGKCVGKAPDGRIVFLSNVVPGDVVNVQITKKRTSYMDGRVLDFVKLSSLRVEPKCEHFGVCGGCKWQNMSYSDQLFFKQKQVSDNLSRLGKIDVSSMNPILGSAEEYFYRNKLEFTFSNTKWLTNFSKDINFSDLNMNGLGFHIPGMFDRVLDINFCHLQAEPSNSIRNAVKKYADEHQLSFFDLRKQEGFLRNMIVRTSSTGDLMVIVVFYFEDEENRIDLLNHLKDTFKISSLMFVINDKRNDTIYDLEVKLFDGEDFIMEEMEGIKFKIGPKSFYQTNSKQAYNLYKFAREFAEFSGDELVYDLYTGTGTIANFIAKKVRKVVGVEYVPESIEDAKINSELNGITNTAFYAGDMVAVLTDDFILENGKPDVLITDPPRAGMHPKVVEKIAALGAKKIVYISCNPATQARDLALLTDNYNVEKIQPVDMFPQTHHVENVVLLILKDK